MATNAVSISANYLMNLIGSSGDKSAYSKAKSSRLPMHINMKHPNTTVATIIKDLQLPYRNCIVDFLGMVDRTENHRT